jgi:hypothetical protein
VSGFLHHDMPRQTRFDDRLQPAGDPGMSEVMDPYVLKTGLWALSTRPKPFS